MKNSKSNVSVIIPCYNDGEYILQALKSIYSQTLLPEQIIVVDDGSNAETKKILATITHPLLRIIHQDNKGVSNARNTAIALVHTEYVLTLDADDYFETTFIEKAIEILINNVNIGVVGCFYRILKENVQGNEIIKPSGGQIRAFLIKNNGLGNSMFRKKCWDQVSGYDEKMTNGYEDWEFWISILSLNWIMHIIEEPLFIYRQKAISRDQTALIKFDLELRKYIFLKHKEIYEDHLDYYILQLLKQNSVLRTSIYKVKNSNEYTIGTFFLKPLRAFKNIFQNK